MPRPRTRGRALRVELLPARRDVLARPARRPDLHDPVAIRVLIQAHPARAGLAGELCACLDGAEVVFDPDPEARLKSPWRTYRACLEQGLRTGADSLVLLQDDVIVCGYLLEAVELIAVAYPSSPVSLFVPGKPAMYVAAISRARAAGERFVALPLGTWVPTVATLWPAALAAGLLEWYDAERLPQQLVADDEIVGRYLRHIDVSAVATVPSLVEHPDTVPSVMNGHRRAGDGNDPGRRAFYWIGDEPGFGCDARTLLAP